MHQKLRTKRSQFRFSFTIYIQRTQLIKNQVILYRKQYIIDTYLSEKLQSLCFMESLETDLEITITTWRRKSISAISSLLMFRSALLNFNTGRYLI